MDLQSKIFATGTDYYRQIEQAIDRGIPQSYLQTILDEYTGLIQEMKKREPKLSDIETLSDLVNVLESEVKNYNG